MPRVPRAPRPPAGIDTLLADPACAAMLLALADGTSRPAGELARAAGVNAPTANALIERLLKGGLLAARSQGRHRYYRLANDRVAGRLETATPPRHPVTPAPPTSDAALRHARTCYRHLAGRLGVALCAGLLERGHLATVGEDFALQPAGAEALTRAGLDPNQTPRLLTLRGRNCLDWTERHPHLGGPLGVALTSAILDAGWLRRAPRGRALLPGAEGLRRMALLGVQLPS